MLEVGQIIDGKYRVEGLLGQGGMGAVYAGLHLHIDSRVAIKVLLPEVTQSPEGNARFEREVRATGRIGNDHILRVHDVGTLPDGSRYMVSELLEGETMASRLKRGALSARVTAELTCQLLDGLAAAHAAGIVHRDLKPDNIFLLPRKLGHADFVKIIDFGVSKFQSEDPQAMSMTTTGAVIGTPYYLSPEQARGQKDIDARSDLYTVGVIMYQGVAGQVPVRADSFNELLFKIALQPPPSLTHDVPGVDPTFAALTTKAMAKERGDRFQNAGELREALEAWLAGSSQASGRRASVPAGWSGGETMAAPSTVPTSSNFGRTSPPLPLYEPEEKRSLLPIVAGIGVVLAVGAAVALLKLSTSHPAVTPSAVVVPSVPVAASSVSSPVPTATEVEHPIVFAPTAEPPHVAPPEPEVTATATVFTPVVRAPHTSHTVHGVAVAAAKPLAPAAQPPPTVAPPPAATTPPPSDAEHPHKHDFGY